MSEKWLNIVRVYIPFYCGLYLYESKNINRLSMFVYFFLMLLLLVGIFLNGGSGVQDFLFVSIMVSMYLGGVDFFEESVSRKMKRYFFFETLVAMLAGSSLLRGYIDSGGYSALSFFIGLTLLALIVVRRFGHVVSET